MGLQDQVASLEERFDQEYPEETQPEEAAWIALAEALASTKTTLNNLNGFVLDWKPAFARLWEKPLWLRDKEERLRLDFSLDVQLPMP